MIITNDKTKLIGECNTIEEFLLKVTKVSHDATGMVVVLWRGDNAWTYQFNLNRSDMDCSAEALQHWAFEMQSD